MNTNTAPSSTCSSRPPLPLHGEAECHTSCLLGAAAIWGLCLAGWTTATASTVLGSWSPLFKGIEHATGTNTAGGGGFPELMVIHCLRVDLTDPDIQLFASPRIPNFVLGSTETAGYTTTNFLKINHLQVAINANGFYEPGSLTLPDYMLPEGTAMDVAGLEVCQGLEVSAQDTADGSGAILFTASNSATFVPTNWPPCSTAGVYTAVSGAYAVLVNGVNVGSNYLRDASSVHDVNPRTAMGLSQDRRYLYLLTIDGRQDSYSEGAYDWETAAWLLKVGAWDGVNLDGGGSTCMAMADSTGRALEMNRSVASVGWGRERTVGSHFGVYAKPLPGYINDIIALPDDTAATITWTTLTPSTTQAKYGLTTNLSLASPLNSALTTNHAVLLTNLTAGTDYYFAAFSTAGSTQYVSATQHFATSNYATTNLIFDLTNVWKYTTANLDGVAWTAREYDDSGWDGSGPGLLWVDYRGANSSIPVPLLTQMPANPSSDYPFPAYYFRTRFTITNQSSVAAMWFGDYLDDGAVFYLNGKEVYRLRMAAAPTTISNSSRASGYPCTGDATCLHTFFLSGPILTTNLISGENVLAVEVHNYSSGSPDITFGLSLAAVVPYVPEPMLTLSYANGMLALSWSRGGFTLQQAYTPAGPWTDVPGPIISSPFTLASPSDARFFRLRK